MNEIHQVYIYIRKFCQMKKRERERERERAAKKYNVQLRKFAVCPFPECVRERRRRHSAGMRIYEQKID